MKKYMVEMNYSDGTTEIDDEVCSTREEALQYGEYLVSCSSTGAEILHLSNPGDYPLDKSCDVSFDVIEIEE